VTETLTPTPTETLTPTPTETPTETPTMTPTETPTMTPTMTPTETPTETPTPTPTETPIPTDAPTPTVTPTNTVTPTASPIPELYQSYNYSITNNDLDSATGNTGGNAVYNNKVVVVVTDGYNCANTTIRDFTYSFNAAGSSYISWLISEIVNPPVIGYYQDDVLITVGLTSTQTVNATVPCQGVPPTPTPTPTPTETLTPTPTATPYRNLEFVNSGTTDLTFTGFSSTFSASWPFSFPITSGQTYNGIHNSILSGDSVNINLGGTGSFNLTINVNGTPISGTNGALPTNVSYIFLSAYSENDILQFILTE
jgi:outer membrane biosynthesis protein TonB